MNGFLRQREGVARTPIPVVSGAMQLEPGIIPALQPERLQRMTVDAVEAGAAAAGEGAVIPSADARDVQAIGSAKTACSSPA